MAPVVPDASVVAKWFLEEPFSREARRLRDDFVAGDIEVHVPHLLAFEVVNALRFSGAYAREDLGEVGEALDAYGFAAHPLQGPYRRRATDLAWDRRITVYDASYAALAESLDCAFFTADNQLLERLDGLAVARHIREYPRAVSSRG